MSQDVAGAVHGGQIMRSLIHHLRNLSPKSYCGILRRGMIGLVFWKVHESCVEGSELMGQERRQADKLGALVEWCTTVREMVVCTRRIAKKTVRHGQI